MELEDEEEESVREGKKVKEPRGVFGGASALLPDKPGWLQRRDWTWLGDIRNTR